MTVTPDAAVRIDYGAKTMTGLIYMHDFNLAVVEKFITDFSDVCPITLVTRQWVDGTHGPWVDAEAAA